MNDNGIVSKEQAIASLMWRFAERWGAQGVNFIVSLVLARLLMPSDYGLIAIISVITSVLNVFIDSGMANALIQKKNADQLDFSTVFYFNVFFCVFLYIILFLVSPFISKLYHSDELVNAIRVLGLTLIVSGFKNTQMAYVSKNMLFKRFFFSTLGGTIVSAVIGILMAYFGLGIWALIAQQLINNIIDTIILWSTVKWRPSLKFSFNRLKTLLTFGWKMLASNLLDTIYNNLRTFIIGAKYSSTDVGLYNKGKSFPWLIIENINSSINSVLLPTLSSAQDNEETLKGMTRRSIKVSVYIIAPLMLGLFAVAEPMISVLITDKWLPCVPYLRIICITYIFYPIHTANLNAILAKGRSDIFLRLEIIKKIIGLSVLFITMNISVMAMAYSLLFTSVASQIINSWPNKKLMNYSYLEQLKDILPGIGLAVFMGGCVYCVNFLHLSNWLTLLIQVPLGAVIYIGLSALLKLESFTYCWNMVKPFINKVFKKNSVQN